MWKFALSAIATWIASISFAQDVRFFSEQFNINNEQAYLPVLVEGNPTSKTYIVFIHGGPEEGGILLNSDKQFTDPIKKKYKMVFYDQRGMGETKGRFTTETLTLSTFTQDLHKIVKCLKFKYGNDIKVFLMGGSWGGMVGTAYLVIPEYQKEISGWIEIGGAHNMPLIKSSAVALMKKVAQQQSQKSIFKDQWQAIYDFTMQYNLKDTTLENWLRINSKGQEASQLLEKDGVYTMRKIDNNSVYNYLFFSQNNFITSWYNDNINKTGIILMRKYVNFSLSDQLYKIKIPSRFFWGEYDFAVPPALAYDAYELTGTPIKNKKMIIFPNAEHSILGSQVDSLQTEIFSFIDKYK